MPLSQKQANVFWIWMGERKFSHIFLSLWDKTKADQVLVWEAPHTHKHTLLSFLSITIKKNFASTIYVRYKVRLYHPWQYVVLFYSTSYSVAVTSVTAAGACCYVVEIGGLKWSLINFVWILEKHINSDKTFMKRHFYL